MLEIPVIKNAAKEREKLFTTLYKKTFPSVAKYISRMGGTLEEAKDIFHDSLVIFYEKQNERTAPIHSSEEAYLLGISKHLWAKRFQQKLQLTPLNEEENKFVITEKEQDPSTEKLLRFLETTGEKCMNLLRAFYYDKTSLDGIAKKFGFSSIRSATVQKFKCLEKIRTSIKEKALHYEDFLN